MYTKICTSLYVKSAVALATIAPSFAFAQTFTPSGSTTIGGMAKNASNSLSGIYGLIMNVALTIGIFLVMLGLWLMYQNRKDEGRTKMTHAFTSMVVGALMIFLPSVIEGTAATAFGTGTAKQAPSTMR